MSIIKSCALIGIEARLVTVEVRITDGTGYQIAGAAVHATGVAVHASKESEVRIRSALSQFGHDVSARRIDITLAGPDAGASPALDLAIAIGVLGDPLDAIAGLLVLGEVGLDGGVRPVRGVLAAAQLARRLGLRGVLVPPACAAEALLVAGIEVYEVADLGEVINVLAGRSTLVRVGPRTPRAPRDPRAHDVLDMADVRGCSAARAAVEIAVAGGHGLLLTGPPGVGKTMLARRIPTIMPPMTEAEAIETTAIYSAIGLLGADALIHDRPFRAPHHTVSTAALMGGGAKVRPGEVSLAHNGVLFLDELIEFQRDAIHALGEPIDEGDVTLGRSTGGPVRIPASFQLIASATSCPCGWFGSEARACACGPEAVKRYRDRLRAATARIEMRVEVPAIGIAHMRDGARGEASAPIRERIIEARARQARRLAPWGLARNAQMSLTVTTATAALTASAKEALKAFGRLNGLRPVHSMIAIARTIADLRNDDDVDADCIRAAIGYGVTS